MARIEKQSRRTLFLRYHIPFAGSFASLKQRGQATVEYVLLLTVAVAIAAVITKKLVSRDPDDAGILIERWKQIQTAIGKDTP